MSIPDLMRVDGIQESQGRPAEMYQEAFEADGVCGCQTKTFFNEPLVTAKYWNVSGTKNRKY